VNPLWHSCKRCGRKGLFRLDRLKPFNEDKMTCRLCGAEHTYALFMGIVAIFYGSVAAYPVMLAFFLPCFETIALLLVTVFIGLVIFLFYPIR